MEMRSMLAAGLLGSAVTLVVTGAAQAVVIDGDTSDSQLILTRSTSTVAASNTGTTLSTGNVDSNRASNAVVVFALPALDAAIAGFAEPVTDANLRVTLAENGNAPTVDLYGVGFSVGAPAADTSLFFEGPADPNTSRVLIQDTFIAQAAAGLGPSAVVETNASGDAALADYINGFYAANPGYTGGSFVSLRVNPDSVTSGTVRADYTISSANNSVAARQPDLELTFAEVPEPASLSLLGLGALTMLRRRRA